uniref:Fungal lipase-like domain-containing protein n=1 Tax=Plectus sambesii TaxID=2011161 RepID=A0A914VZ96_9BILA
MHKWALICFIGAAIATTAEYDFDESLAIQAFYLAAASYSDEPQLCLKNKFTDMRLIEVFRGRCDLLEDSCWAFLAVSESMNTIALSFRGTRSKAQLIAELMETMSFTKVKFPPGGSVERYFHSAFEDLWVNISVKLQELQATKPDYKLLVTGHSLGAALASLASSAAVFNSSYWSSNTATLITFGQPRVGNFEFAQAHDLLLPRSWRVVHRYDCVAHLPYCYERLWSRSCSSVFDHSPYHHGTEIWYRTVMDGSDPPVTCKGLPIDEDNNCSNGEYLHFTPHDHFYYYGKHVSDYGILGCIDLPPPPVIGRIEEKIIEFLPFLITLIASISEEIFA